jgi:hypothetical protein
MDRRLGRLEDLQAGGATETEHERLERLETVRRQAEHANFCQPRGADPVFVIDEGGNVFSSRDGRPITDPRQTLATPWFWETLDEGGEGLVYDEETETFYARTGEFAISRDRVDLERFMGEQRWAHLEGLRGD